MKPKEWEFMEDKSKRQGAKKKSELSHYYPLLFTLGFVFILFQYSFASLEAILYDLRVRYDFGMAFKDNVVLITMDDESDRFLGESYPYTYASHERLMSRLRQDEPAAISYLVEMEEPLTEVDAKAMQRFKSGIERYNLRGGQFRFGTSMDKWGEKLPPRELRNFGHSLALIDTDEMTFARDDVSRRAIFNISGDSSLHLWAANQLREKRKMEILDASIMKGTYYVREADATFFLYRYYDTPIESKTRIKTIPFHRVAVGNFPKGFFNNKIVLVGSQNIERQSDYVLTPFNREEYRAPKLLVHAQIIQSLFQNKTIYQWPKKYSYALCLIIAVALSLTISLVTPTRGLLITLSVLSGIVAIGFVSFSIFGIWIYLTHLVLTVFVVYYIWVPFRAIAEYQRRYAIQEETKLLKKVENLKQNFISLMSHDLKTPVAKIAGLADVMIQQNKTNPTLSKNLHAIVDATKELNKFITSILDLTKIESRNLTLSIVSKDVNQIIENVLKGLQDDAAKKDIRLEKELSALYPISFDIDLVKRVISNLVENALKYSGSGSTVKVTTWDDEKWVYIQISDNGVGIDPADLEHIFDKFYRVKNDASHSIKGTGLGLYLVKYFVELHGGEIEASSTLGQGTVFTVKLKNQ